MTSPANFRQEAVSGKRLENTPFGHVLVSSPFSTRAVFFGISIIALAILIFLSTGKYARKVAVSGVLSPTGGINRVYPSDGGIVAKVFVKEGDTVKKGQVLFEITRETHTRLVGGTKNEMTLALKRKRESLVRAIDHTKNLHRTELEAQATKVKDIRNEIGSLNDQINLSAERILYLEGTLQRYESLFERGFLSKDGTLQKRDELVEQRLRSAALLKEKLTLQRELAAAQAEHRSLPLRQNNAILQMERDLDEMSGGIAENEARRDFMVLAPTDGVFVGHTVEAGQAISPDKSLGAVSPPNEVLFAEIFVPSRAIGFTVLGQRVHLRYRSFPYQTFGTQAAQVISISDVALSTEELSAGKSLALELIGGKEEPVYRVLAKLDRQDVEKDGESYGLRAGMLFDVDLQMERRTLIEWMVEPLFSVIRRA